MLRIAGIAALICSIATMAWAQNATLDTALDLMNRGDRVAAVNVLTPVAEAGDPEVQSVLSSVYQHAWTDLPRDDARAVYWMRRSADQGYPHAQMHLGRMYLNGAGVPQDNLQAHVWMSLGLANVVPPQPTPGDAEAARELFALDLTRYQRDQIGSYMTEEELDESARLQREWRARPENEQ